jgi:hypothetical protein
MTAYHYRGPRTVWLCNASITTPTHIFTLAHTLPAELGITSTAVFGNVLVL